MMGITVKVRREEAVAAAGVQVVRLQTGGRSGCAPRRVVVRLVDDAHVLARPVRAVDAQEHAVVGACAAHGASAGSARRAGRAEAAGRSRRRRLGPQAGWAR